MDGTSNFSTKPKMPSGIPYIIGNEAAERFSYYGMKSILVIFMTSYLRMTDSEAVEWGHVFNTAVYFLPLLGALLSDVFIGKYKTILSLSIVYCLGHIVLALYETQTGLAVGLGLIALGSGGIKPCVSAHVGDQFNSSNNELLPKIFNYFYLAINGGSLISTLATPWLLVQYGPSIAFGIPGGLMILATLIFWLGRNNFVHIKPFGTEFTKNLTSKEGIKIFGRLFVIYIFVAFFWAMFDQTGSTWILQAKSGFMDKSYNFLGYHFELLPSQFQFVNPLLVVMLIPLFTYFIYPTIEKVITLTPLRKITLGLFVASLSFIVIGLAENKISNGETVSVSYQVIAYLILTMAEVLISITVLEFSYSQAPNEMKSFIMSASLFSVSMGNMITVAVNHYIIQDIPSTQITCLKENTLVHTENTSILTLGEKININNKNGVSFLKGKDTTLLQGTFLVGPITKTSFELWDINREPISSFKNGNEIKQPETSIYTLKGADYFYFFSVLIIIVASVFIFVSENYKGKTYLQKSSSIE